MLHLAVKEGNIKLVDYLLGSRLQNMKDFVNMKVSPTLTWKSELYSRFDSAHVFTVRCTWKMRWLNFSSHNILTRLRQAHGHTALHMAAGLHGNQNQEKILQLLLDRGADPSIRNLENDQPAHLLQSGPQGERVSCQSFLTVSPSEYLSYCWLLSFCLYLV